MPCQADDLRRRGYLGVSEIGCAGRPYRRSARGFRGTGSGEAVRSLRLITWNVARRASRILEQATSLAGREPDVVALQEVTRRTLPLWRGAFELLGLAYVRSSLDDPQPLRGSGRRATGVMLASRAPLAEARDPFTMPWPETAVGPL